MMSIDLIRRSSSVTPISPCPKKGPSGISQPALGDTLRINIASPKTTVSKIALHTTATFSNLRFLPHWLPKVVLLGKATKSQFQQLFSETLKRNLPLTDTPCVALTSNREVFLKERPLDSAGNTMKRTISSIGVMLMLNSILQEILLPSMKVNLNWFSPRSSRRQQEKIYSLRSAEDVFREDGWG